MHTITWPGWARERMAGSTPFARIDPAATALLVVDLQNGFLLDDSPFVIPGATEIIPRVNLLAAAVRRAGGQVIFLRHTVSDDPRFALPGWVDENRRRLAQTRDVFRPGQESHQLHQLVARQEQDLVVDKHRYSAMPPTSSDLHSRLQDLGVDTVIITGVATHACCESTARDASMLNYKVIVVADGTATYDDELQSSSLATLGMLFGDVRSTSSVLDLLAHRA